MLAALRIAVLEQIKQILRNKLSIDSVAGKGCDRSRGEVHLHGDRAAYL